jgi:hypothetical protein
VFVAAAAQVMVRRFPPPRSEPTPNCFIVRELTVRRYAYKAARPARRLRKTSTIG